MGNVKGKQADFTFLKKERNVKYYSSFPTSSSFIAAFSTGVSQLQSVSPQAQEISFTQLPLIQVLPSGQLQLPSVQAHPSSPQVQPESLGSHVGQSDIHVPLR